MMNKSTNKFKFVFRLISACLLAFSFPAWAGSFQNDQSDYDSLIVKPKEVILKSKRANRLMYKYAGLKYKKIREDVYIIPLSETFSEEKKIEKINDLKNTGLFDLVEPNYKLDLDDNRNYVSITKKSEDKAPSNIEVIHNEEITPNDKGFTSQYYLREINATRAWNITVGNSLIIGILDTGVNSEHPDLEGKIIGRNEFEDLTDDLGHGTEVAGIIAANTNNNQGIAGIAWNTQILSIKITDNYGQARVSNVVSALEDAYKSGVKIIQISLSTNQFSQTLKDAIRKAQERGILIISTSGNTGVKELRYPAAFNGVIGVGAVNKSKELESYSTTGEHVSLVAPGSYIYTTSSNSTYSEVSGTSFAAPQVAGAAALVWSVNPSLTSNEVKEILIESTDDLGEEGRDIEYGYGLLNIERAVERAKKL